MKKVLFILVLLFSISHAYAQFADCPYLPFNIIADSFYNKWLEKSQFESSFDYQKRIEFKEDTLLKYKSVIKTFFDDNINLYRKFYRLNIYDADNEIYSIIPELDKKQPYQDTDTIAPDFIRLFVRDNFNHKMIDVKGSPFPEGIESWEKNINKEKINRKLYSSFSYNEIKIKVPKKFVIKLDDYLNREGCTNYKGIVLIPYSYKIINCEIEVDKAYIVFNTNCVSGEYIWKYHDGKMVGYDIVKMKFFDYYEHTFSLSDEHYKIVKSNNIFYGITSGGKFVINNFNDVMKTGNIDDNVFCFEWQNPDLVLEKLPIKTMNDSIINDTTVYLKVDVTPQFPQGENALYSFIKGKIKYPENAFSNSINGIVIITVIINADGKMVKPQILSSFGNECDEEALRVVRLIPNWIPGKKDGKNVRTLKNIVIPFPFN